MKKGISGVIIIINTNEKIRKGKLVRLGGIISKGIRGTIIHNSKIERTKKNNPFQKVKN